MEQNRAILKGTVLIKTFDEDEEFRKQKRRVWGNIRKHRLKKKSRNKSNSARSLRIILILFRSRMIYK